MINDIRTAFSKPAPPARDLSARSRGLSSEGVPSFSQSLRDRLVEADALEAGPACPPAHGSTVSRGRPDAEDPVKSAGDGARTDSGPALVPWCAAALSVEGRAQRSDAAPGDGATGADVTEAGVVSTNLSSEAPATVPEPGMQIGPGGASASSPADRLAGAGPGANPGAAMQQGKVDWRFTALEAALDGSNPVVCEDRSKSFPSRTVEGAESVDPALAMGLISGRSGGHNASASVVSQVEAWVRQAVSGMEGALGSQGMGVFNLPVGADSGVSLRWRPMGQGEMRWLLEVRVDPALRTASAQEWGRLGETLATLGVRLQLGSGEAARDSRSGEGARDWHPSRYPDSTDHNSGSNNRRNSHGGKGMPWWGDDPQSPPVVPTGWNWDQRIRVG